MENTIINKDDEQIWYVDKSSLGASIKPIGFVPSTYQMLFLKKFERRGNLEHDESKLQIIPYVVLTIKDHMGNTNVVLYRRKGHEERLVGKFSAGWGGHINNEDESIIDGALRELKEELDIDVNRDNLKFAGYLYSDVDAVSRVHLGMVYTMNITMIDYGILKPSDEIDYMIFEPVDLVKADMLINPSDYEEWTKDAIAGLFPEEKGDE